MAEATEHGQPAGPARAEPEEWAGGTPAVTSALARATTRMGPVRAARTLLRLNQDHGVDCPSCAWPDPPAGHRSRAEFCENGAKAVAHEGTTRRVGAGFAAAHNLADLEGRDDRWLEAQGRIAGPLVRRPGDDRYRPIGWDDALDLVAGHLRALPSPDEAIFYTSGRTSNEAAFAYQLMVRGYGTNNLPDCSNMCHESSGAALIETLGIGKGSVTLDDLEAADVIVIAGQNPGTNAPRMLSSLDRARRRGAVIVAVNPLREAGLVGFRDPQRVGTHLRVTPTTELAQLYLQVRLGGDLALFQLLGQLLLEREAAAPGSAADAAFVAGHTDGFDAWAAHVRGLDRGELLAACGLALADVERLADLLAGSRRTVVAWAMGLTQHKHSVATIREVVNVLLLQGNIGRPGAGVLPVRGHSNVQGDRTMGIDERPAAWFLDALAKEFRFDPPREPGLDTVGALEAMRDGRVRAFVGMGGNLVRAVPDTAVAEAALRSCDLTVQVSTTLNRSHVVAGRTAVVLPVLGRTERDVQASGEQLVSVENSQGQVHASRGRLVPASPHLRSEVAVVCGLARRLLAGRPGAPEVDWEAWQDDYRSIRESIARVVPGFEDYEANLARPGGFLLPHGPRDARRFATVTGRARFTVNPLEYPRVPPGRLLLQTVRSHDQFNTTVYGLDDRYRGVRGERHVVLAHADDIAALGFAPGDVVDVVSEWSDGERRAPGFRLVAYPTARGCAAAYFPEANVLVPLGSRADVSRTPTSKSVVVRFERL
jgi:molybdopterin-dependent oxidoreductase alpha subunit